MSALFNSDGMGSIPAIPHARNVPLLLCNERFNEASLPEDDSELHGPAVYVVEALSLRIGYAKRMLMANSHKGEINQFCALAQNLRPLPLKIK